MAVNDNDQERVNDWANKNVGRIFRDGNQWCVVGHHFDNLAEDPAGFGSTIMAAVQDLKRVKAGLLTAEEAQTLNSLRHLSIKSHLDGICEILGVKTIFLLADPSPDEVEKIHKVYHGMALTGSRSKEPARWEDEHEDVFQQMRHHKTFDTNPGSTAFVMASKHDWFQWHGKFGDISTQLSPKGIEARALYCIEIVGEWTDEDPRKADNNDVVHYGKGEIPPDLMEGIEADVQCKGKIVLCDSWDDTLEKCYQSVKENNGLVTSYVNTLSRRGMLDTSVLPWSLTEKGVTLRGEYMGIEDEPEEE